jgi:hypothetical protein
VYLDNDRVLDYAPGNGEYRVLYFNREKTSESGNSACSGLQLPPIASGQWDGRNHKFVYLGEGELLDFVPNTGEYTILRCSNDAADFKASNPMPCHAVVSSGSWTRFAGGHFKWCTWA